MKSNWREVTVPEMAEFLQKRIERGSGCFWTNMKQDLANMEGKEKISSGRPRLRSLMVYFLTTIAAVREKSQGQTLGLDALIRKYGLEDVMSERSAVYFLSFIVDRSEQKLENSAAAELCYREQILRVAEDLTSQGRGGIDLSSLLDVLVERNASFALQNRLNEIAETLKILLDDSWADWPKPRPVVFDEHTCVEPPLEFLTFGPEDPFQPSAAPAPAAEPPKAPEPENPSVSQTGGPSNPENGSPALWAQIEGNFAEEAVRRIDDGVLQMIFTGAPGTGKTYFAKLIARYRGGIQSWQKDPCAYTLVQFHPSYDYTDFVEGLRPVQLGGPDGRMAFVKLDGAFKAFCRNVELYGNPEETYFFLIDEINRAELSKVFGELMYCLEADKRGKENRVQTQYQNLPAYALAEDGAPRRIQDGEEEDVFAQGFYIPKNVCILGTMNDIDRSVESMDFALRRRFEWKTAEVTGEYLKKSLEKMGLPAPEKLSARGMALNQALLNQGARYGLNKQYFIAQGQFANLPARPDWSQEKLAEYVWNYRVEPLLREYLRGESDQNITEFLRACRSAFLA